VLPATPRLPIVPDYNLVMTFESNDKGLEFRSETRRIVDSFKYLGDFASDNKQKRILATGISNELNLVGEVMVDDKAHSTRAKLIELVNEDSVLETVRVIFEIGYDSDYVRATVTFNLLSSPVEAHTFVKRMAAAQEDKEYEYKMDPGSGMHLYAHILDYIEKMAPTLDQEILHIVDRASPMADQKWNDKFLELLQKRTYEKVGSSRWQKLYT